MIKLKLLACAWLLCALAPVAHAQTKLAAPAIPHLEKRGQATQLIVDGKPFLVLGDVSSFAHAGDSWKIIDYHLQNGSAALNIANVCRQLLEEE